MYFSVYERYKFATKERTGWKKRLNETKALLLRLNSTLATHDNRARLLPRNPIFASKSFEIFPFFVLINLQTFPLLIDTTNLGINNSLFSTQSGFVKISTQIHDIVQFIESKSTVSAYNFNDNLPFPATVLSSDLYLYQKHAVLSFIIIKQWPFTRTLLQKQDSCTS